MKLIFLIGFMGTGKSAVAEALADREDFTCDDLDELIEARTGRSVAAYINEQGEQAFRDMETETLSLWIRDHRTGSGADQGTAYAVLACGGGVILREENRKLMRENGLTVRLMASLQTIYQRVSLHPDTRPMLQVGVSLIKRLEDLADEREALYRDCADLEISTEGKTARKSADLICQALSEQKSEVTRLSPCSPQ